MDKKYIKLFLPLNDNDYKDIYTFIESKKSDYISNKIYRININSNMHIKLYLSTPHLSTPNNRIIEYKIVLYENDNIILNEARNISTIYELYFLGFEVENIEYYIHLQSSKFKINKEMIILNSLNCINNHKLLFVINLYLDYKQMKNIRLICITLSYLIREMELDKDILSAILNKLDYYGYSCIYPMFKMKKAYTQINKGLKPDMIETKDDILNLIVSFSMYCLKCTLDIKKVYLTKSTITDMAEKFNKLKL